MARRKRNRNSGLGHSLSDDILPGSYWEKTGPASFRRVDRIGKCGSVMVSVSCPTGGHQKIGKLHQNIGGAGKISCRSEMEYNDPYTGNKLRKDLKSGWGKTLELAAESALFEADMAIESLRDRSNYCMDPDIRHPVKFPGWQPELDPRDVRLTKDEIDMGPKKTKESAFSGRRRSKSRKGRKHAR